MSGKNKSTLAQIGRIEGRILVIRGQRVIVDADLAELYGTSTKSLNQAARRNRDRFPGDFVFQLTGEEKAEVVTVCDHLKKLRFSSTLPYAFTEHGAIMAASVLNKPLAVEVSVYVVRAFVRLREMLVTNTELIRLSAILQTIFTGPFPLSIVYSNPLRHEIPQCGSCCSLGFGDPLAGIRNDCGNLQCQFFAHVDYVISTGCVMKKYLFSGETGKGQFYFYHQGAIALGQRLISSGRTDHLDFFTRYLDCRR